MLSYIEKKTLVQYNTLSQELYLVSVSSVHYILFAESLMGVLTVGVLTVGVSADK